MGCCWIQVVPYFAVSIIEPRSVTLHALNTSKLGVGGSHQMQMWSTHNCPYIPLPPPSAHSQTCHMIMHRCVMCILATSSHFVSWPVWLTPTKVPRGWQVAMLEAQLVHICGRHVIRKSRGACTQRSECTQPLSVHSRETLPRETPPEL